MPSTQNTHTKSSRFNFRLPAEIKERVEKAAIVSGVTVTDFAIGVLADRADEVLDQQERRILSNRDRDIFLAMLDNPPKPNAALRRAFDKERGRRTGK